MRTFHVKSNGQGLYPMCSASIYPRVNLLDERQFKALHTKIKNNTRLCIECDDLLALLELSQMTL